jgi:DNA polymerase III epsilon subunit-like protein
MYPVGYNLRFDLSFLVELFKKNKVAGADNAYPGSYLRWQDVDLLYLMYLHDFMGTHKLRDYKLGTVTKAYGLKHVGHDALSDTRVVRELTHKFLKPYVKGR